MQGWSDWSYSAKQWYGSGPDGGKAYCTTISAGELLPSSSQFEFDLCMRCQATLIRSLHQPVQIDHAADPDLSVARPHLL